MYCPKCNKEVNTGKLFCNVCGSRLVEKDAEIKDNTIIDINSGVTQTIDVLSMVKSYVGESYDKIRSVNFSIWYFLFGNLGYNSSSGFIFFLFLAWTL